ncbi:MAG: TonB-dependent receptor [Ignavibacteriales bacterium]|nr:MAG: TonB-dependent receptor [Ignavibacteriales bacterium]
MKVIKRIRCNHFVIAAIILSVQFIILPQQMTVGEIQGIVLDISNDQPLDKALVNVASTTHADITDKNGLFTIPNLPYGNYTLEISYIGYKTSYLKVLVDKEIIKGIIVHLSPIALETSTVVITGTHEDYQFDDMNEFINVLKGKELEREISLTLASTLKNETGLAIRSMGPAPARPVIRGLGNDRIQITEDGIQSTDLSSTSPDHAVAIEPFTIERIEVVRGPKVLTQNSTTIGGVVNIIRGEIPDNIPASITGLLGIYGETVNKGFLGSGVVSIPINNFVLRGEFTKRKTDDITTPIAKLKNSNIFTQNYSVGLGFINDWGNNGISIREYSSEYGIPGGFVGAHPNGVDIEIFKRQINFKSKIKIDTEHFSNLRFDFARDYFKQTEYERADLIGAEFTIFNYRSQLELHNKKLLFAEKGLTGLSFEFRDFKVGGFVFTPATTSLKTSLFSFQQFSVMNFNFETAIRFSYDQLKPSATGISINGRQVKQRDFFTYSLSASVSHKIAENFLTGLNLSRSSRVPTIEELYSAGPHLAAYSYETGNPDLRDERGIGTELYFSYRDEWISSSLTFFANELDYYIIPRNSGKINFQTLLPIYQTEGVSAGFRGIEFSSDIKIVENISFHISSSYTYGEIKSSSSPLPQIPPFKTNLELRYTSENFGIGINCELTAKQNRTDIYEEPTSGYGIVGGFAQYSLVAGPVINNFSFVAENIFNKEYRNHLSRVKVILPEASRNFRLTYKLFF